MPAPGSLLSRETGGFTASELEMMAGACRACHARAGRRARAFAAPRLLARAQRASLPTAGLCRGVLTAGRRTGDDEVEIVPAFSFQQTHFLAGSYGPFEVRLQ